jgi:parvulin-like peptidyl-prolyl isomerase
MRSVKLVLPLAAVALLAGCASTRYLARVNDDEIRGDELIRVFGHQHVAMESAMGDERDVQKFLGKVVDRRLFVQEAYRVGLQGSPAVIEGTRRYQLEQLARLLREREVEAPVAVSPEELKAVWAVAPRSFLVRQFVAETREQAEAARARVVAGEELEAVVRSSSSEQSAMHGGLTYVKWGAADQAVERLVFALEAGTLSPVFKADAGWEFLRIEKVNTLEGKALVQVLAEAEGTLSRRKMEVREVALREQLFKKFGVAVLDCPTDLAVLKKAADEGGGPACATWKGGELKLSEIARSMGLEKAGAATPDKVAHVFGVKRKALLDKAIFGLEGEARGWATLPEIATAVTFQRESLMEDALYEQYVFKGIEVGEPEVQAYYQAHLGDFQKPAAFTLAQIVVESEAEAAELRARLVNGASFEELAKERSKDASSAPLGGAIGPATTTQLQGPFAPVAKLEAGELSQPIHSKYGWHVIKALTKVPATQLPFEECAKDVKDKALQARLVKTYETWLERLYQSASVKVSDPGIHAFSEQRATEVKAKEAGLMAKQDAKGKRMEAVKKEAEAFAKAREAEKAAAEPKPEAGGATPADGKPAEATPPPAPPPNVTQVPPAR